MLVGRVEFTQPEQGLGDLHVDEPRLDVAGLRRLLPGLIRSAAASARRIQVNAAAPSPRCAYAFACIAVRSAASAGVICRPAARSAASANATDCRYSPMNSDWLTRSAIT